jgi:putative flippase GtrA
LQEVRSRQRLVSLEIGRFFKGQLSSGIATIVDWGLMTGLILAGVHYLYAVVCGAVAGAITDFSVKKWWVFKAKRERVKGQALRYAVVSAISAGLNCLLAYGLVDGLGIHENIGVIIASTIVGFAWNYPMHRLYVFRPQPKGS